MNSHEIDANNVYMDEQRNHEEDTSIQLGSVKEEDSSFVVNQEAAKEKELEKERQKALNNGIPQYSSIR